MAHQFEHADLFNDAGQASTGAPDKEWLARLLDQYKLYVEMADRISSRRAGANSYFLGVSTGMVAFAGYASQGNGNRYLWLLAVAGIVLSFLWARALRSYRDLNAAKFKVIHRIEQMLPIQPYEAEWDAMGRGADPRLYRPLGHVEQGVPYVYMALHAVVLAQTIPLCWMTASACS